VVLLLALSTLSTKPLLAQRCVRIIDLPPQLKIQTHAGQTLSKLVILNGYNVAELLANDRVVEFILSIHQERVEQNWIITDIDWDWINNKAVHSGVAFFVP